MKKPKKIILLAVTLIVMLSVTSCTDSAKGDTAKVENYIDMVEVCSNMNEHIFYDNNTGVMYYQNSWGCSNCGLTPVYNTDGTIKIYEGWEKK